MTPDWLTEVPFAHRGLHDAARGLPENSLAAFSAAADAGVGVELDVHLTRDGEVVVTHDPDLSRVTGRPGLIAEQLLEELVTRRLGETDERIPTLAQVLEVTAGRVPVMVEVKNTGLRVGALEAAVARCLAGVTGPVCVASFNPRTVGWFARHAPELVRGQVAARVVDLAVPWALRRGLASMTANRWTRPHFVSYEFAALPTRRCRRWRESGRPLLTWTVRTREELARAGALADNVIFEGFLP